MKRLFVALGMVFILSMSVSLTGFAAELVGSDTLADWELKVPSYANTMSLLSGDDGNYYIYPMGERGIPYVMIHAYSIYDSEEEFFAEFTPYMQESYEDLQVLSEMDPVTIDGDVYYETDYLYSVSGNDCIDRRIVRTAGDFTYMFASKEVPGLDLTVGSLLEDTIADCEFLGVEESAPAPLPEDTIPQPEEIPQTSDSYIPEFTWTDDLEEELEEEGLYGSFYVFDEIAAMIWIPDCMNSVILTQDDKDYGYIGYFANDDYSWQIGVTYTQINMTQDEYLQYVLDLDQTEEEQELFINDIPFIKYNLPDTDVVVLATVTTSGYVMEFAFFPASDEAFWDYLDIIGISIQPEK